MFFEDIISFTRECPLQSVTPRRVYPWETDATDIRTTPQSTAATEKHAFLTNADIPKEGGEKVMTT